MDTPLKAPKKVGRPLAFKSVQELQDKIDEYFDFCDMRIIKGYSQKEEKEFAYISPAPYTMHGLARACGVDRDTIINYSHKEEFFGTIKEARNKVAEDVETRLMEGRAQAGAIFNLKNNFGWKDENKTDITSNGESIAIRIVADKLDGTADNNSNS